MTLSVQCEGRPLRPGNRLDLVDLELEFELELELVVRELEEEEEGRGLDIDRPVCTRDGRFAYPCPGPGMIDEVEVGPGVNVKGEGEVVIGDDSRLSERRNE